MIHRFGIKCLLRAGRVFYQSIYALAIRENTVTVAQVRKLNLLRLMMSVLLRTMPAFSKIFLSKLLEFLSDAHMFREQQSSCI